MYYDITRVTAHEKLAEQLFLDGCNCAQAVFGAFCDLTGLELDEALSIAAPFGGGICGLRDNCGALTGMLMALGMISGGYDVHDNKSKSAFYGVGKALAEEFSSLLGSMKCRELLAGMKLSSTPRVRTEEYYKSRPCAKFCAVAAHLVDLYLEHSQASELSESKSLSPAEDRSAAE